jgi:hypothetical protein
MVRLPRALHDAVLKARMLLQGHDELVFEVTEAEVEATSTIVRQIMDITTFMRTRWPAFGTCLGSGCWKLGLIKASPCCCGYSIFRASRQMVCKDWSAQDLDAHMWKCAARSQTNADIVRSRGVNAFGSSLVINQMNHF